MKLTCKCGYHMSVTEAPNDIELWVYTDREWDEMFDCESIEPWKIPLPRREVWKCPACERVYCFREGEDRPFRVYAPEPQEPG